MGPIGVSHARGPDAAEVHAEQHAASARTHLGLSPAALLGWRALVRRWLLRQWRRHRLRQSPHVHGPKVDVEARALDLLGAVATQGHSNKERTAIRTCDYQSRTNGLRTGAPATHAPRRTRSAPPADPLRGPHPAREGVWQPSVEAHHAPVHIPCREPDQGAMEGLLLHNE